MSTSKTNIIFIIVAGDTNITINNINKSAPHKPDAWRLSEDIPRQHTSNYHSLHTSQMLDLLTQHNITGNGDKIDNRQCRKSNLTSNTDENKLSQAY